MCCGLWKIKSIIKSAALDTCDNPQQSNKVFDEVINEELIYGQFSRSLLGNDNLSCHLYAEGSAECDNFFVFLYIMLMLVLLVIVVFLLGVFYSIWMWYSWRKSYLKLLRAKAYSSLTAGDEKSRFLQMNGHQIDGDCNSEFQADLPVDPPRAAKSGNKIRNIMHFGTSIFGTAKIDRQLRPSSTTQIVRNDGSSASSSQNNSNMDVQDNNFLAASSVEHLNGKIDRNCTSKTVQEHEMVDRNALTPSTDGRCSSSASTGSSTVASSGIPNGDNQV